MPKTRRASRQLPEFATTMHGLNEWYNSKVERLGMIVLTKARGEKDKVAMYKRNLRRLHGAIKHLQGEYKDVDRLHDLNVLCMNVECLQDFVGKHL